MFCECSHCCDGKSVGKLHFEKLVLVEYPLEGFLLLLPAVPPVDQVGLGPGQYLPVFEGPVVRPALVFECHVLPAVFLPDVGVAARVACERLDGDLEVGAEDVTPQALPLGKSLVTLGGKEKVEILKNIYKNLKIIKNRYKSKNIILDLLDNFDNFA